MGERKRRSAAHRPEASSRAAAGGQLLGAPKGVAQARHTRVFGLRAEQPGCFQLQTVQKFQAPAMAKEAGDLTLDSSASPTPQPHDTATCCLWHLQVMTTPLYCSQSCGGSGSLMQVLLPRRQGRLWPGRHLREASGRIVCARRV